MSGFIKYTASKSIGIKLAGSSRYTEITPGSCPLERVTKGNNISNNNRSADPLERPCGSNRQEFLNESQTPKDSFHQ